MEGYSVKAILSVTDKGFTSGMSKALSSIEKLSKGTSKSVGTIGKITSSLKSAFSNTSKEANKATNSVSKLGSAFKSTASAIGAMQLASKAIGYISDSIGGAISRYDTLNRFPKVLSQIGFSAEDSKKSLDKLSKGIQGLPTTLNDVAATTQRIAILTGDLDKATKTTLALNDAFLASGSSTEDAQRGLQQYVQMLSRGEVDLESWRSLQETMGVALNDVAKAFGYAGSSAQSDLYDALQSGEITFDEFNDKLIELDGGVNGFAERAKTASDGIATAMTNLKTAVNRGIEGVIRSIDKVLTSNGLPTIQQSIEKIGSAAESAINKVSNFIGLFQNVESPSELMSIIQGIFDQINNTIQTNLPLMITKGTEILKNIAYGIVYALPDIAVSAIETVTQFVSTLSENLDTVFSSAVEIVKTLVDGIEERLPDILEAGVNLIVTIVEGILDNLPDIVDAGMEIIGELIVGIGKSIPDILKAAKDLVIKLGDKFLETDWGSIGSDIISGIASGIRGAADALWRAAKSALGSFKDKVLGFFGISGSGSGKSGGSARTASARIATARTFSIPYSANTNYQPALASVPGYQSVNSGFPEISSLSTIADNMTNRTFSFDMSTDLNYIALSVIDERDKKIGGERGNGNKIYLIENTIELNGREIARSSAKYMEGELKKIDKQNNRKNGIR